MADILTGFVDLEDVMDYKFNEVLEPRVREAIAETLAFHNAQVDALFAKFVHRTTEFKIAFRSISSGTLQPLDERGNPLPIKGGVKYDLGLPIQGAGSAWGDDRVSRAKMTIQQINDIVANITLRDLDWLRRHLLAALFYNVAWTYDDPDHGELTIQPLANNDTVTYNLKTGPNVADNHYKAQAAAISDAANPYPAIRTELSEHPENSGPWVSYIPTNLRATTLALATFHPVDDPNIRKGDNEDQLVGSVDKGFGDEVLGYVEDGTWIVEWSSLPDNYIVATGDSSEPAVAFREHEEPELQGLFEEIFSSDGNLKETRFIRYGGFGGWNRIAAVVQRIGNAAYAPPAGYTSMPLPV